MNFKTTITAVLISGFVALSTLSAPALADKNWEDDVSEALFGLLNQYRGSNGLPALNANDPLINAAQGLSDYMASSGTFSHTADGRSMGQRMQAQGYRWCSAAENIANNYNQGGESARVVAKRIMKGWKNSSGHNANMLKNDVADIGIGTAEGGNGRVYATQVFGRSGC